MKNISALIEEAIEYTRHHMCVDSFVIDGLCGALEIAKVAECGETVDIKKICEEVFGFDG